jgi:hypothetical protein
MDRTFPSLMAQTIPLLVMAAFLGSCAGYDRGLLARDYPRMSDEDLLAYYYELSREIDQCVRSGDRTSVGVGTGFGLGRLGVWLGLSRGISSCDPRELIQQQARVRLELDQRGLSP